MKNSNKQPIMDLTGQALASHASATKSLVGRRARYYPVARLAHLERLASESPIDFIYNQHRADWDDKLASSLSEVHHLNFVGFLRRVWKIDYDVVEIPEPLAVALLPRLVVLSLLLHGKNIVRRKRTRFVAYAIENLDQASKVKSTTRLPYWMARACIRLALRLVFTNVIRLAFGTEGARTNYKDATGPSWAAIEKHTKSKLFVALPSAADCSGAKDRYKACFVGSFEDRKGIRDLIEAWPLVLEHHPEANITILGHGPLEKIVREFASDREDVQVEVDPPRDRIWDVLHTSHCLVLPSRRTARWREQVGLPIIEALSVGCEIVTTTETGIADWLHEHGHQVLGDPNTEALANAIGAALMNSRSSQDILSTLPHRDTRAMADAWMFGDNVAQDPPRSTRTDG